MMCTQRSPTTVLLLQAATLPFLRLLARAHPLACFLDKDDHLAVNVNSFSTKLATDDAPQILLSAVSQFIYL